MRPSVNAVDFWSTRRKLPAGRGQLNPIGPDHKTFNARAILAATGLR
jgi:hypothetical protein